MFCSSFLFFFQAEDGIRDIGVTGVQTALPIYILGSIPRGIEKSGALAGQIAEKLVGSSATSLAGRSGQKAIAGAARAIAEEIGRASCRERGERAEDGGRAGKSGEARGRRSAGE